MTWTTAEKTAWQREQRRRFVRERGYSETANRGAGGRRAEVLLRDGSACVKCGMTDADHKATWGRPITIDHIDRDRSNNDLSNLQTLCLRCHGAKDISPQLVVPQIPEKRGEILGLRNQGRTFQEIADATGFSIGGVWKWVKRWEAEAAA